MIHLDLEQRSPEWIAARLGIPSSSQFHRILTPSTMKLSKSADSYAVELITEKMLGASLDPYVSDFMERGSQLESQARAWYELQTDRDTTNGGFCMSDDRRVGCSPDRLVGDDGGLEIKCPSAAVHVGYMLDVTSKYRAQIQGGMYVTGRKWWDFVSWSPELPPVLVRFERDQDFIDKLHRALVQFCGRLDEMEDTLRSKGYAVLREVTL